MRVHFSKLQQAPATHFDIAVSHTYTGNILPWTSPHLYFGDFEEVSLPRPEDWPWSEALPLEEQRAMVVIGSAAEDAPICIDEESEKIYVLDQNQSSEVYTNNAPFVLPSYAAEFQTIRYRRK